MREFSWRSRKQWGKTHLVLDLRVMQDETIKESDSKKILLRNCTYIKTVCRKIVLI